jgi:mono/diheme cytochrome c family protein
MTRTVHQSRIIIRGFCLTLILAGLVLVPHGARSQPQGDTRQGENFAKAACSQCHAVGRKQAPSPNRYAPSFHALARSPGMTATKLHLWFETPHPSMPNLILRSDDKENVFAYIMSLKNGYRP